MKDGIVVVYKHEGITSQAAVNRVKRLFGAKKAGHSGTLDPMACGVLPVMMGKAVKASDFLMDSAKHYKAKMKLGITTDTEDITGKVIGVSDLRPTFDEVRAAAACFVGEIMQTPPMYSALKVGGRKLYEIARSGESVERTPRKITVYSIDVEKTGEDEYTLDVKCSKGTYIRTICKDIGEKLGCGATMSALERAESGGFSLASAHTLEEMENMSEDEREKLIVDTEEALKKYACVTLDTFFARLAHNGLEIYLKKIKKDFAAGTVVRMCDADGFFALGEVREYNDGPAIKPIRMFRG